MQHCKCIHVHVHTCTCLGIPETYMCIQLEYCTCTNVSKPENVKLNPKMPSLNSFSSTSQVQGNSCIMIFFLNTDKWTAYVLFKPLFYLLPNKSLKRRPLTGARKTGRWSPNIYLNELARCLHYSIEGVQLRNLP